jgi:hypothetical protein
MSRRPHLAAAVLPAALAVASPGLAQGAAFEQEDSYFLQPPLTLPEGINGVLRASARPAPVGAIESARSSRLSGHAGVHPIPL